jgi:hypothetical protein
MGRFETQWLAAAENLSALADLSGQWIDLVHGRRPPRGIVLDMDSSVSPTHGEQESGTANNATRPIDKALEIDTRVMLVDDPVKRSASTV